MNIQERHEFYKILLTESNNLCIKWGFCSLIRDQLYVLDDRQTIRAPYDEDDIHKDFPELYNLKPKNTYNEMYWFATGKSGWKKRIELLKICIEQTKSKDNEQTIN